MDIIVFGNVPLATWVVKKILDSKHLNLLGIVCDPFEAEHFQNHGMEEPSLFSYAKDRGLNMFEFEKAKELAKERPIFGISVRYDKLFKEDYFVEFNPGIVNLHGGELPRFRGANIANYAILEGVTRGAGTIHFISKGLDEGDVVMREYFEVSEGETAYSFFIKTLSILKIAFEKLLEEIDREGIIQVPRVSQEDFVANGEQAKTYYKKGIEKYRLIEFSELSDWDSLYRKVRAFYFPGHQGALLKNGDEVIEMTLK